jgi:predicted site-specific integrase-resolvase
LSDYLTISDVARRAEVCNATVHNWEKSGKLPALRTEKGFRFFEREKVERFLAERKQNGGGRS